MAFARRRRFGGNKTATVKQPKVHTVDGITYKSKALAVLHEALKGDALVTSFHLPNVQEEKENKNRKYGAKKCMINDIIFDSIMEGRFYVYLLHLKQDGQVKSFTMQTPYVLQDKYRDKFTGKAVPAIKYIADFVMTMPDDIEVVIDVKGKETADFKLKKKMFGYRYRDIQFMCVQWSESKKEWRDLSDIEKERREKRKTKKEKAA